MSSEPAEECEIRAQGETAANERSVLRVLLGINAVMFLIELLSPGRESGLLRAGPAVAAPQDEQAHPRGLIPALQVNAAADGSVDALDLQWYVYQGTAGYVEVTDPDVFTHSLTHVEIGLAGPGAGATENLAIDPRETT